MCQHQLFSKLGLLLRPVKLEGPSTCLFILGIEFDSITLQARLLAEKREDQYTVRGWSVKRFCNRQELESLIGHLHHTCKVSPQSRKINLRRAFRRDDHPITLHREFQSDLAWWRELFKSWDGLSFFLMPS